MDDLEPVVGGVGVLRHRQDVEVGVADPGHLREREGREGGL